MNLWPIVFLSKLYVEDLEKRKRRSLILNMSSNASDYALPFFAVYAAGKAFGDHFSRNMGLDLAHTNFNNVDVLSVRSGFVDTPMTQHAKSKQLEISPEECAEGALRCVGALSYTSGHFKHVLFNIYMKYRRYWMIRPVIRKAPNRN